MKLKPFTREERIDRIKQYLPIFLLGVLGTLSAIALNLYLIVTDQYIDWISSLLAFIPGLFLLLRWRFGKNISEKKWVQVILGGFLFGCFSVVLIIGFLIWYDHALKDADNTIYYSTFYRLNAEIFQEKYSQFPERIPEDVKNAKFTALHWLGEGSVLLSYTVSSEEILAIKDQYQSQSICILDKGQDIYSLSELQEKCGENFFMADLGRISLETVQVFALNVFIEQSNSGSDHCDASGIAIDETNSVVYYWVHSYWCPKEILNHTPSPDS